MPIGCGSPGAEIARRTLSFVHRHVMASAAAALALMPSPALAMHLADGILACQLSAPLSPTALIEALAIAVEARTAAVLEAGVPSRRSGAPATGTDTDCVVVAAPGLPGGAPYAGKHTAPGHLVGAATHEAVRRGVAGWLAEHAP